MLITDSTMIQLGEDITIMLTEAEECEILLHLHEFSFIMHDIVYDK